MFDVKTRLEVFTKDVIKRSYMSPFRFK